MYNWQHPDFPNFPFDTHRIHRALALYEQSLGTYLAEIAQLPELEQQQIHLTTTVEEGVQSSSIEGEEIARREVQSSLLNNLRFGPDLSAPTDLRARSVARMMEEVLRDPSDPLTEVRLRYWHELLFRNLPYPGIAGSYRSGDQPMRIVSGPEHAPTVHFEAPPAERVPELMRAFVAHLEQPLPTVLRAGLGYLHFESIHPFSDGNGRIGRAILERMILQPIGGQPVLSISHAIRESRDDYYQALKTAQNGFDATDWLTYFFGTLQRSIQLGRQLTQFTLQKIRFFERFSEQLSPIQEKALRKMWEAGPQGFTGGMTTKKYRRIHRVSAATASRDLHRLVKFGALEQRGAGRSTHYLLRSD